MQSWATTTLTSGINAPRHWFRCGVASIVLLLLGRPVLADDTKSVYRDPPSVLIRNVTHFGIEMVPVNPGFQLVAGSAVTSISCPAGQPFSYIETWMAPPHGVQLLSFRFVGKDTSPQEQTMFAFRVCQSPINASSPSAQSFSLGSVSSGNPSLGNFAKTLNLEASNEIVDAVNCRYLLRTRLSNQNQACVGADMQLHKITMSYRSVN